jgi:hypothetical protein
MLQGLWVCGKKYYLVQQRATTTSRILSRENVQPRLSARYAYLEMFASMRFGTDRKLDQKPKNLAQTLVPPWVLAQKLGTNRPNRMRKVVEGVIALRRPVAGTVWTKTARARVVKAPQVQERWLVRKTAGPQQTGSRVLQLLQTAAAGIVAQGRKMDSERLAAERCTWDSSRTDGKHAASVGPGGILTDTAKLPLAVLALRTADPP